MKLLLLILIVFGSSFTHADRISQPVKITYAQVVQRVSTENLVVYQNALKVYQAKQAISVARGNLLPKLNIWRILSVPFDPRSAVGLVEDIAPFLIPANWFQLKAQKEFYAAEVEGYKALWANEVMTAKSLYLQLLADRQLLRSIELAETDVNRIWVIVKSREMLGQYPEGTSKEMEVRLLALKEDTRALRTLIAEEVGLLSQMLGFAGTPDLDLEPVALPDFEKYPVLSEDGYVSRVLTYSPELKQYSFLVNASRYVKQEAYFSLFGIGTLTRGVAGGIFDNVPIQDGLGFGTPASVRIAKTQTKMLQVQQQGASETLRRQLRLVVATYNLDVENFADIKKRARLAQEIRSRLYERLSLGEDVEMNALLEASRSEIQSQTTLFQAQYRYLANVDKLERLAFMGDYDRNPLKP